MPWRGVVIGLAGGDVGLDRVTGAVRVTAERLPRLPLVDPPPIDLPDEYPPEPLRLCASACQGSAVTARAANSAPNAIVFFMLFSLMSFTESGPETVSVQGQFLALAAQVFEIAGVEKGIART